MKAIIFDIDWVVITSDWKKKEIIKNILQKYYLYNIPWVRDILALWLNRKLILDRIYELTPFDKKAVLKDINDENAILESNAVKNTIIVDFIKNNSEKYILCTNTALPIAWLNRVIEAIDIWNSFKELLAFENWSKVENVNYILDKYTLNPRDVLFIDDNINHINKVKVTWVNALHFIDYDIDIEKEIETIKILAYVTS